MLLSVRIHRAQVGQRIQPLPCRWAHRPEPLLVHLAAWGLWGPSRLRREGCGISQAHNQMATPPQGPGQNPSARGPLLAQRPK